MCSCASSSSSSSVDDGARATKRGRGDIGGSDSDERTRLIVAKMTSISDTAPFSAADHRAVVDEVNALRTHLANGGPIGASAVLRLTCAGIAAMRRAHFATNGSDDDELALEMCTTCTLLFVVVAMASARPEPVHGVPTAQAPETPTSTTGSSCIEAWTSTSLHEALTRVLPELENSSWAHQLRTPGAFCSALIGEVQRVGCDLDLQGVGRYAHLFFQQSAEALAVGFFDAATVRCGGDGFVSLAATAAAARGDEPEYLAHLADCGESEHGQQIFRDLVLSFKLPRSIVGVRRTSLLGRATNARATRDYTAQLGEAHQAAMRGTRWTWDNDDDPTHRTCALLAGVAVAMCPTTEELRRADMFGGRVQLPFLLTHAPPLGVTRLALLAHSHEWVVYTMDRYGTASVRLRVAGHDGARRAIALFHGNHTGI